MRVAFINRKFSPFLLDFKLPFACMDDALMLFPDAYLVNALSDNSSSFSTFFNGGSSLMAEPKAVMAKCFRDLVAGVRFPPAALILRSGQGGFP